MFRFLRPVKLEAVLACIYLSAFVAVEVTAVRWTAKIVDQISALRPGDHAGSFRSFLKGATELRLLLMQLAGFMLMFLVLRYLREVANSKLSMRMVYYIREAIYDKLQRVGFSFHDALSSGQLINRALSDLQNVRTFLQSSLITTLDIFCAVGFYICLLWTRSHTLAALALIPLPIWTFYIVRYGRRMQPANKLVLEADDRNVSLLTENIAGVHVVKAFATQDVEIEKYNANCDTFIGRVIDRVQLQANFTPIIRSIGFGSNLSLVFAVSYFAIKGSLNIGDIFIIMSSLNSMLNRLQQVNTINDQYQNAIVSARRLYEVLMAPPTVVDKPKALPLPKGWGDVHFENVTFGYDPAKPVLHNITFHAQPGMNVAIVGPTGAGKTTLVNLIARFYDPQCGQIVMDGANLKEVALSSLRSQVAFVFQESYLFSDTVEANIAYGRPGTRGGEVEAAARLAQAHDFIEQMAHGYQTVLGERGSSLSGGQRQRLAIARAILFNPRILILDDATAAVDPETEDMIRRGMRAVMLDRTTFTIAHRISTVKRADLVLVLENGRITQMGTHAELMLQDGHYREIAAVQLYSDEDVPRTLAADKPSHMDRVQGDKILAQAGQSQAPAATVEGEYE